MGVFVAVKRVESVGSALNVCRPGVRDTKLEYWSGQWLLPALVAEGGEGAADDFIHGFGDRELTGADGDDRVKFRPPAVIVRKHHAGVLFEGEEFLFSDAKRDFGGGQFELALEILDFARAPQLSAERCGTLKFGEVVTAPFGPVVEEVVVHELLLRA